MYYENKKDKKILLKVVLVLLILVIVLLLNLTVQTEEKNNNSYSVVKTAIEAEKKEKISKEEIIKNAVSCVVGISKLEQNGTSIFLNNSIESLGLGSGVIVSENGYILTNEHVSGEKYSNCYITLENGKSYNGSVVWADKDIDLAIIKIDAYRLDYLDLADSDNVYLGEDVYAIGNPIGFEFQRTVTKGIISGMNRTIKIEDNENSDNSIYMEDLIQTDSTINEGNSGGPLIDEKGKVVGITSVKLNQVDGMSFAVPINIVKPILEKLLQTGKYEEAYLGIYGFDSEVIPYLEDDLKIDKGIYVARVVRDSSAFYSGINNGDIITKVDNYEINKISKLKRYIYQKNPGDRIRVLITRNHKEYEIEVELNSK